LYFHECFLYFFHSLRSFEFTLDNKILGNEISIFGLLYQYLDPLVMDFLTNGDLG